MFQLSGFYSNSRTSSAPMNVPAGLWPGSRELILSMASLARKTGHPCSYRRTTYISKL